MQTTVQFKYRLLMGDFGSTSLERQNHNHTHKTQILEWFTHNRATSTMFVFAFHIWDLYIIYFTLRERLESLSEWEGENGRVAADPSCSWRWWTFCCRLPSSSGAFFYFQAWRHGKYGLSLAWWDLIMRVGEVFGFSVQKDSNTKPHFLPQIKLLPCT